MNGLHKGMMAGAMLVSTIALTQSPVAAGTLRIGGVGAVGNLLGGSIGGTAGNGAVGGSAGGSVTVPNLPAPSVNGVLATAGNVLLGLGNRTAAATQGLATTVPAVTKVTNTVKSAGQALANSGQTAPLQAVRSALGEVATVKAGNGALVGPGADPLVAVNLANRGADATGSLATVGVVNKGEVVTVAASSAPIVSGSGAGGALGGVVQPLENLAGAVRNAVGTANQSVTVTVGNATVLNGGATPVVGASVLSPTQATGSAVTAGVASGGTTATAIVQPIEAVVNGVTGTVTGAAGGVTGVTGAVTGTVGNVVGTVTGATGGTGTAGNLVGNVVQTVSTAVSGATGASGTAGGVLGGVTGRVGGLLGGLRLQ